MNNPVGSVFNALHTKLVADATLVSLTGHTLAAPAIGSSYPHTKSPVKFLAFQLFNSRPLLDNATQIKIMRIDLLSFCVKKPDAIAIIDHIEYLFDNPDGDNASYYDFSDDAVKVCDTRPSLRLPEFFHKEFDRFAEGLRITTIVNPYNPCS